MLESKPTILVVDDDATFRTRLVRALSSRGYETFEAGDVDAGIARARQLKPARAIVDLRMPGKSGLDLISALMEIDDDIQILVLTGYGSIATAVEAVRRGAIDYLSKPVDTEQILAVFDRESATSVAMEVTEAKPSLARVEWEHIQRVLSDCGGNISEAARQLGIHRRSLQRKLSKLPPLE
ncbi:MAG: two-component system, response regulator RegA [Phycisphaerales bacterium]|jgi:two-component system response regulator RegA|nr:two-component system, response regulator RegA [Phycisphaerales bacterium]